MRVPDNILKCVVFLVYDDPDGNEVLAGTGFFVGITDGGRHFPYLVTAAHVVEGIRNRAINVFVRMNAKTDNRVDRLEIDRPNSWSFHPTDRSIDVAAMAWPSQTSALYDFLIFPVVASATPQKMTRLGMGIGDEVFIIGLYTKHAGTSRNNAIVRIGNLAATPIDSIITSRGQMIGHHLVEIRSIGGISGSPAFIRSCEIVEDEKGRLAPRENTFYLLGLMHGRWDIKHLAPVMFEIDSDYLKQPLNSGIAVVVPVQNILETINQPVFVNQRKEILEQIEAENATTPCGNES
jgi:hypothetical protein